MKTIIEYQPLLFSALEAHARQRTAGRRQLTINLTAALAYGVLGFWMCLQTGFQPWHWQFWAMFGPFFLLGEVALRALLSE